MKPTPLCIQRLTKEYRLLVKDPIPNIQFKPQMDNILIWHYVIPGPKDTPLEIGQFYGTIHFHPDYPFKPPSIYMDTPSGVFTDGQRVCIDGVSDYHPESWIATYGPGTIILALQSFFYDKFKYGELLQPKSDLDGWYQQVYKYSRASYVFNLRIPMFTTMFPQLVTEYNDIIRQFYLNSSTSSSPILWVPPNKTQPSPPSQVTPEAPTDDISSSQDVNAGSATPTSTTTSSSPSPSITTTASPTSTTSSDLIPHAIDRTPDASNESLDKPQPDSTLVTSSTSKDDEYIEPESSLIKRKNATSPPPSPSSSTTSQSPKSQPITPKKSVFKAPGKPVKLEDLFTPEELLIINQEVRKLPTRNKYCCFWFTNEVLIMLIPILLLLLGMISMVVRNFGR